MDGLAGTLKVGASSRRLELPKAAAGADSSPPPDPSLGLTRAWTDAERLARWPALDYSQPRDLEPECDGIYGPHNALRSDMAKLLKALEALSATDAPTEVELANLSTWFDSFAHLLHAHHGIEEHVFVPFLTAHGAKLGDRIAKSHVQLVATLEQLHTDIASLRALDRASRPAAIAAIAATTMAFVADMRAHLTEEEDTVIPATVNHLNRKTEAVLMSTIIKHVHLADAPEELAWILHSASPLFRKSFTAKLPPPLRWHLPKWERHFVWRDSHIISIYDKTTLPPQQVAQPPGGFCCC